MQHQAAFHEPSSRHFDAAVALLSSLLFCNVVSILHSCAGIGLEECGAAVVGGVNAMLSAKPTVKICSLQVRLILWEGRVCGLLRG